MHFRDHSPAHFHAEYGEYEALVEIETPSILRGEPWRWYSNGQPFIARNWERTGNGLVVERL
jgi:hypothetical protein